MSFVWAMATEGSKSADRPLQISLVVAETYVGKECSKQLTRGDVFFYFTEGFLCRYRANVS